MRLVVNLLILIMVGAGVIAMLSLYKSDADAMPEEVQPAQQAIFQITSRLDREYSLHMAAYPDLVPPLPNPEWFGVGGPPTNPFTGIGRQWMDVAQDGDLSTDPPDPFITNGQQAAFWFNPNNRLVRARVPQQITDLRSSELYNAVNGTHHQEMMNREYAVISIGLGVDQAGRPLEAPETEDPAVAQGSTSSNSSTNTGHSTPSSQNRVPAYTDDSNASAPSTQSNPRERRSLLSD